MASTYPTSLDAFTNPTASSLLTSPSHAQQHSDINDAMEAVQTKLAIGNTVIGTYTAYTPTVSNVVMGNATFAVNYARVNNFVHYYGAIVFGTTSTFGGSPWNISLPINCATPVVNHFIPVGQTYYFDQSTGAVFTGDIIGIGSATVVRLRINNVSATYGTTNDLSSVVPFTWTTSDKIQFSMYYQAA